jgi:hypothetical protein
MISQMHGPRKQRTRQHVIADLAVHHVEGFMLEAGHTVQRLYSDYGYDLVLFTYDERGYLEPGSLLFQLKSAERLSRVGGDFVFDLDIRDYRLWMLERAPVILILFDATRRRAYWLAIQKHFRENARRQPKKGAKTVRVRIPSGKALNRRAVAIMRQLKQDIQTPVLGVQP